MPTVDETVQKIAAAETWDKRVAQIRLIPQHHGNGEHPEIYANIAKALYVPHLVPDFAYVRESLFYEPEYFTEVYASAERASHGFTLVSEADLARIIEEDPRTLLVFRTITGLLRDEFAQTTKIVAKPLALKPISKGKVGSMERKGTSAKGEIALVAAKTLYRVMDGSLFGRTPGDPHSKQVKPDTHDGWPQVQQFAAGGVPYALFLHQRHYGGAFRQLLDATSTKRGDLFEDAVEALFKKNRIPYIRTGGHDQGAIAERFEVTVAPAPDFVVFDQSGTLRAMLECKTINDGGTARDKASRFTTLRAECARLNGVPLVAVLGGMGWTRTNDTLGPVVRDTEGRVFTLANLQEMMAVAPFPSLIGIAPPAADDEEQEEALAAEEDD